MENLLTIKEFDDIQDGNIFRVGKLKDIPGQFYVSSFGQYLKFVAVKGVINDWTIYYGRETLSTDYIMKHGNKVQSDENIRKCVPCTDEVLKLYRH